MKNIPNKDGFLIKHHPATDYCSLYEFTQLIFLIWWTKLLSADIQHLLMKLQVLSSFKNVATHIWARLFFRATAIQVGDFKEFKYAFCCWVIAGCCGYID